MRNKLKRSLVLIVTLGVLGGCAVGPNYKRPAVEAPGAYRFATGESASSFADLPWWQVFQDPILQGLIGTALTNNYDLKQAVSRVEQSRNLAVAAGNALHQRDNPELRAALVRSHEGSSIMVREHIDWALAPVVSLTETLPSPDSR